MNHEVFFSSFEKYNSSTRNNNTIIRSMKGQYLVLWKFVHKKMKHLIRSIFIVALNLFFKLIWNISIETRFIHFYGYVQIVKQSSMYYRCLSNGIVAHKLSVWMERVSWMVKNNLPLAHLFDFAEVNDSASWEGIDSHWFPLLSIPCDFWLIFCSTYEMRHESKGH